MKVGTKRKLIATAGIVAAAFVIAIVTSVSGGPLSLPDTEVVIGFTPDNKWITTAAAELDFKRGPLTLRSTENGDVFRQFANDAQMIGIVQFSPNGEFVSAVCDGRQRVWRIADGEEIERDPSVYIRSFLQPDGQELQLLTCNLSGKSSFRIESFESGQILHEGGRLRGDGIGGSYDAVLEPIKLRTLKPSQSGKYVVARTDEDIQLWREGQEKIQILGRGSLGAISPDDRYFATYRNTREEIVFELFDVATGKRIGSQTWTGSSLDPSRHIDQPGHPIYFDPDKVTFFGNTLVADARDVFTVFDTTAGKLDLVINRMAGAHTYVVSPEGKWCSYPGSGDPSLIYGKVLPDVVPVRIEVAPPANLPSSFAWHRTKASQFPLAFSEDGKKLACFDRKKGVFIMAHDDDNTWKIDQRLRNAGPHSEYYEIAEFSPDGTYFRWGRYWWKID